jgi:NitT/TauT family transport system ATP-binding protein
MIVVTKLQKTYRVVRGQDVCAIEDITFRIGDGEFVSVVGPSGCGKTTLLRMVGGLLPKTGGEILLDGTPVDGPRRDIGMVFQNPVLLPWRTALQNSLVPIEVLHLDKVKYAQKAHELIDLVGLHGFEDKYPYELSGGMQQRNALVRALIYDPKLLLMDEPFGALDAMTRERMNLELMRIWSVQKKTILFVTHSIPEACFLADRVLVLSERPSTILEAVDIVLPRPRNLDMMGSPEFTTHVRHIRSLLGEYEANQARKGGYESQSTEF